MALDAVEDMTRKHNFEYEALLAYFSVNYDVANMFGACS